MSTRGFTLVELLLALLLGLVVAAGASAMAAGTRRLFMVEPVALDAVQRVRSAGDVLVASLATAGGAQALADGVASPDATAPPVRPLPTLEGGVGGRFTAVHVWRAIPGAYGRLATAQPGGHGRLALDRSRSGVCPALPDVCGFQNGDAALVADGRGRVDVFIVGAADSATGEVVPSRALAHAYPAGAWVVAVRAERLGLARQPDGSSALVRVTAAGAREPLLDGIVDLEFEVWGTAAAPWVRDGDAAGLARYGLFPPAPDADDPAGVFAPGTHCMVDRVAGVPVSTLADRPGGPDGLTRLTPADLDDGPWCPYAGAPGAFDADVFRIRRIDVRIRVEAQPPEFRGLEGAVFGRPGTAAHEPSRWVRDRLLSLSVSVGR